jgi:hypothetical protein
MEAWIEITTLDGLREFHPLADDQITLGRSARAGIAVVNQDELQPEHLLLAPQRQGCWVAVAQGVTPVPMVNGEPHLRGLLPWGTTVELGELVLRFTDRPPRQSAEQKRSLSPMTVLVPVLLGAAAWLFLSAPVQSAQMGPRGTPPTLFTDSYECPVPAEQALPRAREEAESASRKSERYPFDPRDGIESVLRWGVAETCYAIGGSRDDAQRVAALRTDMERRILEDYGTRQLSLQRALEHGRYRVAWSQAHLLNAMVAHLEEATDYTSSLVLLERQLRLQAEEQEEAGGR